MNDTAECICQQVPARREMVVLSPRGVAVARFHVDCPVHGIGPSTYRTMKAVVRKAWLTVQEAWAVARRDGARVLEKSKDRTSALVEWTEYEFEKEHENV